MGFRYERLLDALHYTLLQHVIIFIFLKVSTTANISNLKTDVELWAVLYFAENNVTHCWQNSTTVCNSFTVSFSAHQRCLEQSGAPNSFLSSVTWQYESVMDGASQTGEHSSHRTYPAPEADAILGGQTPHSHLLKPVKKMSVPFLYVITSRMSVCVPI
jgi:hypothetical protein